MFGYRRFKDFKLIVQKAIILFASIFFSPIEILNKWRGIPYFIKNWDLYRKLNNNSIFSIKFSDVYPVFNERFDSAGSAQGHYFFQDIWAAREVFHSGYKKHTDVGSRLDGFVSSLLTFCQVEYVDLRPLSCSIDGLVHKQGSILDLPFPDNSLESLSCLHVLEHIGLGRYGDPVDPQGYLTAADELTRVLSSGGQLILGVPIGRERVCFDAHRIFDPQTIVDTFNGLLLKKFDLIDDAGNSIINSASFSSARKCQYGCGLFIFEKK